MDAEEATGDGGAAKAQNTRLRPRDAATLIVLDRRGGDTCVLLGRRHARHVFMPSKFVFPGGRTDPADGLVAAADALHPAEAAKLRLGLRSDARARAIALSAVREAYEEAGLLVGRKGSFATGRPDWLAFAEHGVRPALAAVRYIARAITPPGQVRRFDTRFLAVRREDVAVELPGGGPSGELEELAWVPLPEARRLDVPEITAMVLDDLAERLRRDPLLTPGGPIPFYRQLHGSHRRFEI